MDRALKRTHEWFEVNSGWAPPDPDTLAEWAADGVSKAPDDCYVPVDGGCEHGLASWHRVLDALDPPVLGMESDTASVGFHAENAAQKPKPEGSMPRRSHS